MDYTELLPPLPEADPTMQGDERAPRDYHVGYNADQLCAFALAAIEAAAPAIKAAEMARCIRLIYGHCGSDNDAARIVDAIRKDTP